MKSHAPASCKHTAQRKETTVRDQMPWWFPEDSIPLSERFINSWARHRLVAASSRRTDEKVASRSGSGRQCRRASRARALSLSLHRVSALRDISSELYVPPCCRRETSMREVRVYRR